MKGHELGSPSAALDPKAAGSRRVLIVDDEPGILRSMSRVLTKAGFEVVTAESGEQAATLVGSSTFDVVLSDIQLGAMSGIDLLRHLRNHDLDVPVLLMTARPTIATAIEAVRLGAVHYMLKPIDNEDLMREVERASQLHRMATLKRAALSLAPGGGAEAGDRAGLEASFDRALATLWVAFQPIVTVGDRRVVAYEALMRASEPSLPHPGAILSAAEELDRLAELGQAMRKATADAFVRAPEDARLFVNLHPLDLLDTSLCDDFLSLRRFAPRVVLEVTERAAIASVNDAVERVTLLRSHGYRIAIDDLGAGYAGLSSFVALDPQTVKLDMSLVRDVDSSPVKARIVGAMVALCHEMSMEVVAEGIETEAECATIERLGCDLMQGYLFGRPSPKFV